MPEYRVSLKEPGDGADPWHTVTADSSEQAAERYVRERATPIAPRSFLIVDPPPEDPNPRSPYLHQLRLTVVDEVDVDHGGATDREEVET